MSKIEELIKTRCPNGVKYRQLCKVCKRQKGISITASDMKKLDKSNAPVRIFAAGNTVANVDYSDIPEKSIITKPSIIVKSRGNIGFEYYTKPFTHKNEMWSYSAIDDSVNLKFIFYYLQNHIEYFQKKAKTGKLPQISTGDTDDFSIPMPPIEVQQEIVRILDNFTELTAELTAELEARKKQYEYYRDKLLSFDKPENPNGGGYDLSVEYKKLGEIAKIHNGADYKSFGEGDIPVYGTSGIMTYIDRCAYDKPTVLIPRKGSIEKLYYVDTPFWNVDTIFYTEIDTSVVIPKYLYYLLKKEHLEQHNTAGGIPSLTQSVLKDIALQIPPIDIQQRIVNILDKFEILSNSLVDGLPAEIEARRKQYEYYRDLLLDFSPESSIGGGRT